MIMLPRPLLHQWKIISQPIFSRWLGLGAPRTLRLSQGLTFGSRVALYRHLSTSLACRSVVAETTPTPSTDTTSSSKSKTPTIGVKEHSDNSSDDIYDKLYLGPLGSTFRRLKIFSLSSLALSTTLAPFIFVIESNLPPTARLALASIAITTSMTSTVMVAWVGKPYVTELRYIRPEENGGAEGMEMTTMSLTMKPRVTTVYDPSFLVETRRGFAKWELAQKVVLAKEEGERHIASGQEETIAETRDKDGHPLGCWVVTWGENNEGTCRELGSVERYFNVHEELLP